jgi:hypothetical protein
VRVVERSPVGHVTGIHANTTAGGAHEPRLGVVVAKTTHDIFNADLGEDGDTVPLPLAVVGGLIAELLQRRERELRVILLRLLDEQNVGRGRYQPLFNSKPAGRQRIDVPGGYLHASSARMNNRSLSTAN